MQPPFTSLFAPSPQQFAGPAGPALPTSALAGAENVNRPSGPEQSASSPVFNQMTLSNVLTDGRFRSVDTIASAFGMTSG
jgi:hypothetical protein